MRVIIIWVKVIQVFKPLYVLKDIEATSKGNSDLVSILPTFHVQKLYRHLFGAWIRDYRAYLRKSRPSYKSDWKNISTKWSKIQNFLNYQNFLKYQSISLNFSTNTRAYRVIGVKAALKMLLMLTHNVSCRIVYNEYLLDIAKKAKVWEKYERNALTFTYHGRKNNFEK